ncbi:MAG: IPT/TIG domain-containing protein [Candidatus Solibacter sp.]
MIALAVDPRDALTVYAGSGGGGVWKSTDGGATWNPLTDSQASLSAGAIAIDPVNPDTIYVGTGEINACQDCYPGGGILKSRDAGQTWQRITGPFVDSLGRGARIAGISVNANNPQVLLAAAFFLGANGIPGVYRSADGGATWQSVLNRGHATAVAFDPVNTNVAYAGLYGGGLYRSVDTGLTWQRVAIGDDRADIPANIGRVDFALAPSDPTILYAAFADLSPGSPGGTLGVFRSADSGATWQLLPGTSDYCSTTCGYDSVIAVDPGDSGTVFLGGVQLRRSTDGGQTWQDLTRGTSTVFPPPNQHALAIPSNSTAIYTGNDGGVNGAPLRSDAAFAWTNLNQTLAIAEFTTRVSIHPSNPNLMFGGVQKNGIQRFDGTTNWLTVNCLDGGASIVNQSRPSMVYASCSQQALYSSSNTGNTWSPGVAGIDRNDRTDSTPPLVNDVTHPERLYFGTFRVYRSDDGGGTWAAISPALGGNATVTAIGVSPSDPSIAYAGTSDGLLYVTPAATENAATWTERTKGLPKRAIRRIVVDASNASLAYLAVAGFAENTGDATGLPGHLFQTSDGGSNWKDVSGNLPNIPVNDLAIDTDIPGVWYAATDAGVFLSADSGAHWSALGSGLPNVVVRGLTLHRASRTLRAATHGRGVWELPIPLADGFNVAPGLASVSPNQSTLTPAVSSEDLTVTVQGSGFVQGATVNWNGSERPTTFVSSTQLTAIISAADLAAPSLSLITARNPSPGGGVSNTLPFTVAPVPMIQAYGIVDAASYQVSPLSPGSIATLTGINLALATAATNAYPLPKVLAGTSVRVGFIDAPLTYVSPTSISFQIPWELVGQAAAIVQVRVGDVIGPGQSIPLGEYSPGIFTLNQTGSGPGYVTIANQNETPVQPIGTFAGARPASPGEQIAIFCSGLGTVANPPASGVPSPSDPFAPTLAVPLVSIGGQPAQITFNALAPGLVGVYVLNALVPAGAQDGDAVPVMIKIGGRSSNTVTIAIHGDLNLP